MFIREAVEEDFDEITAIYNEVVTTSTAIYNDKPTTREERIAWWRSRREQGYPMLVAVTSAETAHSAAGGESVAGFGTFGDFRPWPGYRYTVEGTIHIHPSTRGKGVGTELLKALITRARELGKHVMIAGVDAENQASLHFLERFGFERVACLREVGYKFERFLDLVFLQYWITPRCR